MTDRRLVSLVAASALLAGCASQPEMVDKPPQQLSSERDLLRIGEWKRKTWPDEPPMPSCRNMPAD